MEQSKFYQIKNITEREYTLVGCDGSVITRPIQDVDKSASAFTIQDAKDGDVLATDSCLYIFKYTNNKAIIQFHCTCPINGKSYKWCFLSDDSYLDICIDANIHPATKEQRDLLFKKMREAGYEWDAEKKELKKIEQKTAEWSEEDELSCFESALFTAFSDAWQEYLNGEEVNVKQWAKEHSKEILEAAKEELKEQKPAWSEEDKRHFELIILICEEEQKAYQNDSLPYINIGKAINWLKSVRLQSTWKPSAEQMKALKKVILCGTSVVECGELNNLYEDLKKLKG